MNTAREIARQVVRPVLLEGNRPAMAIYAGDNCKFHFPVDLVMGKNANVEGSFHVMLNNMRTVIEEAVKMSEDKKIASAKFVALQFSKQQAETAIKPVKSDNGIILGISICVDDQQVFYIPVDSDDGETVVDGIRTIIQNSIQKAVMDFYHWHVSNEMQDYIEAKTDECSLKS